MNRFVGLRKRVEKLVYVCLFMRGGIAIYTRVVYLTSKTASKHRAGCRHRTMHSLHGPFNVGQIKIGFFTERFVRIFKSTVANKLIVINRRVCFKLAFRLVWKLTFAFLHPATCLIHGTIYNSLLREFSTNDSDVFISELVSV